MDDMTAKKKGGGVTIRLGLAERRTLEAAAERQHLPVSTWLRQVALKAAAREELFDETERRKRVAKALVLLDTHPAPADDLGRRRAGWGRKP
jgi:uncharacterized protein (DUF1778 family)